MGRIETRLERLERMASGQHAMRKSRVAFVPTESLEQIIQAAQSGLSLLEIEPFALSGTAGNALADALLEGEVKIARKCLF